MKGREEEKGGAAGRGYSDEELREKLTPEQYHVTCQNGTERPFENAYWDNKRPGIYVDVISGEPLFSSIDKFDSGTGWPSFTKPIDSGAVATRADMSHGMARTEVRAKGSGAHLGHVFEDGPLPARLRYCINSAALRFIPAEDLEREGYGEHARLFKGGAMPSSESIRGPEADSSSGRLERATFGAGCFWGVEAAFRRLAGVVDTAVGYSGGTFEAPTYVDVCTGKTGHAEVVQVTYDPSIVSYEKLLEAFWKMHDPTSLNRQGPDVGSQYRSVIFYNTLDQEASARRSKGQLEASGSLARPVVTEIAPASTFYRAEEYHQRYLEAKGNSCSRPEPQAARGPL